MQMTGPDNEVYDFPDDVSYDQILDFFGGNQSKEDKLAPDISRIMQESGGNRTPFDTLKDVATGLGNAGQNIGNMMIDRFNQGTLGPMAEAMESSGKEIPSFIQNQLNSQTPQINMQDQFGTQGGNPLVQALSQYAPGIMMGGTTLPGQALSNAAFGYTQGRPGEENLGGLLPEGRLGTALEGALGAAIPMGAPKLAKGVYKNLSPIFGKTNEKSVSKIITDKYDDVSKRASDIFNNVEKEAVDRNINIVPIKKSVIEKIKDYLPSTKSNKSLIEKAKSGDYKELRKLQSDLRERGEKLQKSPLQAERDKGEEMLDLRSDVNNEIAKNFKSKGHEDLANSLMEANGMYKELKQVYGINNAIKKLTNPKIRKIPKNISSILSEESKPMERFMEYHPGLREELFRLTKKQKSKDFLRKGLIGTGLAGGTLAGGKTLLDFLNPK